MDNMHERGMDHAPSQEKDVIPDFEQLEEKELAAFNHPRPEFFDLKDSGTPEWLKHVAGVVAGGDERFAIAFPAGTDVTAVPGLTLLNYDTAVVLNNGEIIWGDDLTKFKKETDELLSETLKHIPNAKKIVFVAE